MNLLLGASLLYLAALLLFNVASRIKNKQLSKEQPTRSLTQDEISAIQPFIHVWPSKRVSLKPQSNDVYTIVGKYTEHHIGYKGLKGVDRYLAGIRIILPFDARNFMTGTIEAEVATVRGFVILISSSNGFNILESAKKYLEAQIPKNEIPVEEIGAIEFRALARVEEIGRRKESLIEVRHFRTWDRIWYIPVFFMSSGYLTGSVHGLSHTLDAILDLLFCGVLSGTLLIYYFNWRWVKPKCMVRELKGRLFEFSIPSLGGEGDLSYFFLGTETALNIPKHWRDQAKKLIGTEVQLSLSTRANHVVAIDKISALESEERLLPAQPWGGHAAALLTGLFILFSLPIPDSLDLRAFLSVWSFAMVAISLPRLIRTYRATVERKLKLSELLCGPLPKSSDFSG